MPKIADNLTQVQKRIQHSAQKEGRNPSSVTLLAVSKRKHADLIREAYQAGQRNFGENYLQEALEKQSQLEDLDIQWHFIGSLQSNKARAVAENFNWFHTLDRPKIADKLNQYRPASLPPLQVCLQVNIDQQESKSGCPPQETLALAQTVSQLPNLRLRGLMAIPDPSHSLEAFHRLRELRDAIVEQTAIPLDTLSMGMSADLEQAISAGATMVRVGTDIFGQRD